MRAPSSLIGGLILLATLGCAQNEPEWWEEDELMGDLLADPDSVVPAAADRESGLVLRGASEPFSWDRVTVEYGNRGCFHALEASFEIRSSDPDQVIVRTASRHEAPISEVVSLDDEKIEGLDACIAYYRDLPTGTVSTTVSDLEMTWWRGERAVRTEAYHDPGGEFALPPALFSWYDLAILARGAR